MHGKFADFSEVKGYATYERAHKRGLEVQEKFKNYYEQAAYRWLVIALPNGRFAPCIVINNNIPGGPGLFMSLTNVCLVN